MSIDPTSERAPSMPQGIAFASLLQAVAGLRNRDAIVALLGCLFSGLVISGVLLALAGGPGLLVLLASLVWLLALATGINAAGLLQMDHARRISPRSLGDALVHGLMCIPKLIVLGLALFAAAIVVFIVLALLLVVCKIPYLGALLFVVVFPLSVLVAGVTVTGLLLCGVLSLPAIWQGASIARALAQTFAIVKSRLVEALLLLAALGLICFVVGLIVFGILMAGLMPTLGLSLSIVGFGGFGSEELMAMAQGYALDGHAIAGLFGGLLLWAIAGSLVGQVYLLGLSLVYLKVTEGLDLSASEAALRATFEDAKRRAAGLAGKPRAEAMAPFAAAASSAFERSASASMPPITSGDDDVTTIPAARPETSPFESTDIDLPLDVAPPAATPSGSGTPPAWQPPPRSGVPLPGALPAAPPLPAITTCPHCLSSVAPEDSFCGVCGYRLK
jgi:hypothetical protein